MEHFEPLFDFKPISKSYNKNIITVSYCCEKVGAIITLDANWKIQYQATSIYSSVKLLWWNPDGLGF